MSEQTSDLEIPLGADYDHDAGMVDDTAGENAGAAPVAELAVELVENPTPARKDEPTQVQAPEVPGADVVPKRGRGRPKKAEQAAAPAKRDAPGADVTPKRQEQLGAVTGMMAARPSALASMAMLLVGWPALTPEEAAAVDEEFKEVEIPLEYRKIFVVGLIVAPRAMADNRVRRMIGLDTVDGGDTAERERRQLAELRAELERTQAAAAKSAAQAQAPAQAAAPAKKALPTAGEAKTRPPI